MIKLLTFAVCVVCTPCGAPAQATAWQPAPGHSQMPLWPGTPPDAPN